jgi:hypothetical protein
MVLGKQGLLVGHPCVQGLVFFGGEVKEGAHDLDRNGLIKKWVQLDSQTFKKWTHRTPLFASTICWRHKP